MDAVFKQYGVCEDVADMIAKKVHEGHQKKINDHLDVIIGWNNRFDYWTIGNFKPKSLFWPYQEPRGIGRISRVLLQYFRDRVHHLLKTKAKTKKITKEEYMSYVLSGKEVFMMHRRVRWNRFVFALDNLYTFDQNLETPLSVHLSRITETMNRPYKKFIPTEKRKLEFLQKNPDYDPVRSFIHKETLQRKHLISWLNKNGDPRRLTGKTKKQLWDIIMKLK